MKQTPSTRAKVSEIVFRLLKLQDDDCCCRNKKSEDEIKSLLDHETLTYLA
jgi:hypothetical protein